MGFFDWLRRQRRDPTLDPIERALAKVRGGEELTDEELARAGDAFSAYYQSLSRRHRTEDNTRFGRDGLHFYEMALKMAALGHPGHNAWPILSGVRWQLAPDVTRALQNRRDPWMHLMAIQPLLLAGDRAAAEASLEALEGAEFERALAIRWLRAGLILFPGENAGALATEVLNSLGKPAPWLDSSLPDDVRWILLASIFPDLANDDRQALEDARPCAVVRCSLEDAWGVRDRESAEAMLKLLSENGHSASLRRCLDAPERIKSPKLRAFVEKERQALARHHILAWDLGRAIAVARASVKVGYLDAVDGQAWVNEFGRRLAGEYTDWQDFGEDYILGNRFFHGDASPPGHEPQTRWLMNSPESPWKTVSFGAGAR